MHLPPQNIRFIMIDIIYRTIRQPITMHTIATILHHFSSIQLSHLLFVSSVKVSLLLRLDISELARAAGHNLFDPPSRIFRILRLSLIACGIIIVNVLLADLG